MASPVLADVSPVRAAQSIKINSAKTFKVQRPTGAMLVVKADAVFACEALVPLDEEVIVVEDQSYLETAVELKLTVAQRNLGARCPDDRALRTVTTTFELGEYPVAAENVEFKISVNGIEAKLDPSNPNLVDPSKVLNKVTVEPKLWGNQIPVRSVELSADGVAKTQVTAKAVYSNSCMVTPPRDTFVITDYLSGSDKNSLEVNIILGRLVTTGGCNASFEPVAVLYTAELNQSLENISKVQVNGVVGSLPPLLPPLKEQEP